MNYILNETTPQFFLDEKFDLCERFILNEDETSTIGKKDQSKLQKDALEIKNNLADIYKLLFKNNDRALSTKESNLNKILNHIISLKNLINQDLDPTKLKPKVTEFIEKFQALLTNIVGTDNYKWEDLKSYLGISSDTVDFVNELQKTVEAARNSDYSETNIKSLISQVNTLYDVSKSFIEKYSDKDTTKQDLKEKIDAFKKECENTITGLTIIIKLDDSKIDAASLMLATNKLANSVDKTAIEAAIKSANSDLAKVLENADVISLQTALKEFNNKYLNDLKELAKEYNINTSDANSAIDTKDWDKTYKDWPKDTKSQEQFWNLYFKTVWGSDAQKIAYLGEAFRQELVTWGFTEARNPFITFVKKYLLDKKYNITGEHYEKLHNAVVYGKVSRNLLKCTLEKHKNIIFNRTAYRGSASDFEDYLDAQYTISGTTGNADIEPLKDILFTMGLTPETANSTTGHLGIIAAIMFGNADTPSDTMKNFKEADWVKADWEELKINSVQTVKSLLNDYIGGEISNKVKIATLGQLDTAGKSLAKAAIEDANDGIIKLAKMYSFLIRLWAPEKIDDILNKYKLRADSDKPVQAAINRDNLKIGQTINDIVTAKNGFNIADIEEFTKVLSKIGNVPSATALQSIDTIITSGGIFGA